MTIRICGNSHLAALRNGNHMLGENPHKLQFFPFGSGYWTWDPFSTVDKGGLRLTPAEFQRNMKKHTGGQYFSPDDRWGICIGGHSPRLYGSPHWKWCRPAHLATKPRFRPISDGLLDALILQDHRFIYQFLEHMQQAKLDFFVIATPPPPPNFHGEHRTDEVETIAYIETRSRKQFRDWVKNHGIDYIDLPDGIMDETGFIKPAFKQDFNHEGKRDAHHANEKYGGEMVKKINAYLSA